MLRLCVLAATMGCAACGLLFATANWPGQPYSLTVADHVTASGQARTGSVVMTLEHDGPCAISVSVAQVGDEILTCSTDTLNTSYKLTGDALQNGDSDWVDSSPFLTRNYDIQGNGPSDEITLWVRGAAFSNRANVAGTYSASVVLTVSWQ